ncbi:MAG TPA: glycosyltransferase family 4 protein [Cytophagaceae bacterium]|jgi:glycosyltransferase involved in cell wall biosynthesis
MKILYIHQYFKTPEEGGAIRSYYLSTALAKSGHEVHLITASNEHLGSKIIEGINVHYLPVKYDNNFGYVKRIWAFSRFMGLAFWHALKIKNIDICYATSTPLSVGVLALLLKKINGVRYYFEVRDLWPAVPIAMGYVKNTLVIYLLNQIEKIIYRNAEKIVSLSPEISTGIRAKSNKDILLIPNIADCRFFHSDTKAIGTENLCIAYIGSIGKSNGLTAFLALAKYCKKKGIDDVNFFIAGDGAEKNLILSEIEAKQLDHVAYLGTLSKIEVKNLLDKCTAVYISFADHPILSSCSPNKFFDGVAAGKIIITNYKGWVTDLVIQHGAGFFLDRNNPEDFSTKVLPSLRDMNVRRVIQTNSYNLAKAMFDRPLLEDKFLSLFSE